MAKFIFSVKEILPKILYIPSTENEVARVVSIDNPKGYGMPVPASRERDWARYVAQYDPFNWSGRFPFKKNYRPKKQSELDEVEKEEVK